ncbi:hypothetical protein OUZ56_015482 [Daphnia magna]|uniref:Uncharacterized protein n=1 Tax=Daphnia magna TaxID=35525 RepID=A0ABR0AN39_9CRUS|nr:hypothetical protein OUZ56_015482 [Daphnia magna]
MNHHFKTRNQTGISNSIPKSFQRHLDVWHSFVTSARLRAALEKETTTKLRVVIVVVENIKDPWARHDGRKTRRNRKEKKENHPKSEAPPFLLLSTRMPQYYCDVASSGHRPRERGTTKEN